MLARKHLGRLVLLRICSGTTWILAWEMLTICPQNFDLSIHPVPMTLLPYLVQNTAQDNIFMGFAISWGWDAFRSDGRRVGDFNLVILAPLQAHDEMELAHPCL
jgi:hypothetical protein